ncbi:hypothetical protein NGB36_21780 [Streptomyces sp. RB6PN25]|uniref:Uncharacterized protein n=1 Tax=Streptomyces humicola TaxID=2953240 RepID=A0ABT1PZS6_9ACTN|nr:hypothetical protein [Streptomyces humicola]MCQ4083164.1 hypothetical protein [Streptomyces humicola]
MASYVARGTVAKAGGCTLPTLAQRSDTRNTVLILFVLLGCVINGESLSSIFGKATGLIVAVTVLIIVRVVGALVIAMTGPTDISV